MEVKAGANVSVIPATKRFVRSGAVLKTIKELRVAAYCRVSTGNDSFDFFIKQLGDLPTKTSTGQPMNINTVTVDYENKGDSASVDMTFEQLVSAPDLLPFDKYFYHTHIIKGVVYGDVIEYTTTFGMKLKSVGDSRTIKSFLGFRRQKSDGTYEPLLYTWQVINNSVQYRRKKK